MTALHAVPNTGHGFTGFNLGQTNGQRFSARTQGQNNALEACLNPALPFGLMTGPAGTGKTLMGMAAAMHLRESRQHGINNIYKIYKMRLMIFSLNAHKNRGEIFHGKFYPISY